MRVYNTPERLFVSELCRAYQFHTIDDIILYSADSHAWIVGLHADYLKNPTLAQEVGWLPLGRLDRPGLATLAHFARKSALGLALANLRSQAWDRLTTDDIPPITDLLPPPPPELDLPDGSQN